MAAQVMQVQKKEDPLQGVAMEMGKSFALSKLQGMGSGTKKPEAKPDPASGPVGTSLKELINAGGSANQTPSNPRDRRMYGGY